MKILIFFLINIKLLVAIEPVVIVHGGAGTISAARVPGKYRGSKLAAKIGYKTLIETGNVLDAVEAAIRSMELDENFNAGYGGVLTRDGNVEMDASIMDGKTMAVGAVTGVQNIYHPITLARRVMEKTPHNFLSPIGAMNFAKSEGFNFVKPGMLITENARNSLDRWLQAQQNGTFLRDIGEGNTVGAVAIDEMGNIAAATSTGGMTGKMPGRIGDSPIIGSGTYANNLAGFSATGDGEVIMKAVLIMDIIKRMEYLGEDAQTAADNACEDMTAKFDGDGGVVGLDNNGNVAIAFTSEQLSWAYQKGNKVFYGVNRGDNFSDDV